MFYESLKALTFYFVDVVVIVKLFIVIFGLKVILSLRVVVKLVCEGTDKLLIFTVQPWLAWTLLCRPG